MKSLRVNTYSSTPVVALMDSLRNRIELSVHTNCNTDSNNDIHCHVITKLYVMKAVKKLKPDKVNKDGL